MSPTVAAVAAVALIGAWMLSSCGSGGSSEAKVIPNPEFLAKATRICKTGNAKIGKQYSYWGERAHLHADSEEFMNRMAERVEIPVKERQVRELRALGLPAGKEQQAKAFLAAMEEGIEKGKKDSSSLRVGDYAFRRAFEMAESVGLKTCFLG